MHTIFFQENYKIISWNADHLWLVAVRFFSLLILNRTNWFMDFCLLCSGKFMVVYSGCCIKKIVVSVCTRINVESVESVYPTENRAFNIFNVTLSSIFFRRWKVFESFRWMKISRINCHSKAITERNLTLFLPVNISFHLTRCTNVTQN